MPRTEKPANTTAYKNKNAKKTARNLLLATLPKQVTAP